MHELKQMLQRLGMNLAATFRRETLSTRYIPELDGLRCIAVLLVLFYHLDAYLRAKNDWGNGMSWLGQCFGCGYFGVEIFFVISGYIILLPFVPRSGADWAAPDLLVFYVRRLVRVWPPYAIALTGFLLAKAAIEGEFAKYLPGYFASLGFVHNALFHGWSRIVVVAWTLEVEVQFYLLAPLLSLVFLIDNRRLRRSVIGFAIVASSVFAPWCEVGLSLLQYSQYFFCGLLLADLSVGQADLKRSTLADLIALGLVPLLWWSVAGHGALGIWIPVLLMVIIAVACRGNVLSRCLAHPLMRFVGGMCFSIYLLHYPVISFVGSLAKKFGSLAGWPFLSYAIQCLILIVAVLVFSIMFFVFVEKPFMRRKTIDWVVDLMRGAGGSMHKSPQTELSNG